LDAQSTIRANIPVHGLLHRVTFSGDNISLGHHIAVIPASNMVSAAWNVGSNDTSKMYVKSDIRIVTIQGGTIRRRT